MRRHNSTLALAVLALLVMSCTPGVPPGPGPGPDPGPGPGPYAGGTEGLSLMFMDGAPPAEIYDNGQYPFQVTLQAENVGESDIVPGDFNQIRIVGINAAQWGVTASDLIMPILTGNQALRGAVKTADGQRLRGDTATATIPKTLKYIPDIAGTQDVTLRAEMCYDYRTRATAQLCFKADSLGAVGSQDDICSVNEQKTVYNSGAPLHITSLQEAPQGQGQFQIQFTVEHVGAGKFFQPDSQKAWPCDSTSVLNTEADKAKVTVRLDQTSGFSVSCPLLGGGNSGIVRLPQGAAQVVVCTLSTSNPQQFVDSGAIFQDNVEINLEYTYGQFIQKSIVVRDITAR